MKTKHSKRTGNERSGNHTMVPDLPSEFLQTDHNTFRLSHDVSSETIIAAAESIIEHRIRKFPIVLNKPSLVKSLVLFKLAEATEEHFCVLFLTHRLRLICFERLFKGTINKSVVYPREIIKRAMALNAGAVILVHNHPSGVCEPSSEDKQVTRKLKRVLDVLDIQLLDHFIVGHNRAVFSFAEEGKL